MKILFDNKLGLRKKADHHVAIAPRDDGGVDLRPPRDDGNSSLRAEGVAIQEIRPNLWPFGQSQKEGLDHHVAAAPRDDGSEKMTYKQLSGDETKREYVERILRVNHAGEYAAKVIYGGQYDGCADSEFRKQVSHMKHQEEVHLAYFEERLRADWVRPSLLMPFWRAAGYALGYVTARMGPDYAMACTKAVEEVIEGHYQDQLAKLEESELKLKVAQFMDEEVQHCNIAKAAIKKPSLSLKMLESIVRVGCRAAIKIAGRI